MSSHGKRRAGEISGISFIRMLILFIRVLPSTPNHLSKAPLPNAITLEAGISPGNFGGTQTLVYCRACLLTCKQKTKYTDQLGEVKEGFSKEIKSKLMNEKNWDEC